MARREPKVVEGSCEVVGRTLEELWANIELVSGNLIRSGQPITREPTIYPVGKVCNPEGVCWRLYRAAIHHIPRKLP